MLMHNSGRPTDGSVKASGIKKGNVLVGTEEDFTDAVRARAARSSSPTSPTRGAASPRSARRSRSRTG